ncbi:MAG: type transport system permease protein, partial [Acidobacteriaceae bacterium]
MVGLEMNGTRTPALSSSPLGAIVVVRWQILANSLRSVRGRVDLFARVMMWTGFAGAGIGGAFGLGRQAADFISQGQGELLSILLWPSFIFWQLFPLLTTAFSENLESSILLRFPISYRSYLFVRIVSGSLDTANALGMIWLTGIAIGIGFADKYLLPWSALALLVFATLNIFLARAIFAWLEHWLARRSTRELMAVLLFLL